MERIKKINPARKSPVSYGTFGLILFLLLVSVQFLPAQAIARVEENKKSFGKVNRGEFVQLEYTIVNDGTEPLIIKNHEVSCTCTSVSYDHAPLLPAQKTVVKVTFDTKTVYEKQDRMVILFSNNKAGNIKLRFKGYVINNK